MDPAALGGVRACQKWSITLATLHLVLSCDASLWHTASNQQLPGSWSLLCSGFTNLSRRSKQATSAVQVFLGKFRGRGPLPIPGGPLIGAQGPVAMPISDAAAQRDESPATLADATADEPLVAEPSHSGHSSGGGCVSGSGGSAGTSVREHTPECAAAQPAGPAGESSQAEPSSRDSSPASADAGQGGAISPPAGGWRPARPRQRRPVRQAATDDAVNTQRTARSPQTRRQLALQQERWELEVALARSAAEVAQPAAAAEAASPALTAPAAPPLQPAQPAATPPLVPAVSAEVAAQLAPTDPPAAAGQNTADDAAAAQAAQATSASDDAAQQSKAPEATPAQEPSAAAAMSEPATGLLSDEETVSLVAVSDDDVDIGTTSALQVTVFVSLFHLLVLPYAAANSASTSCRAPEQCDNLVSTALTCLQRAINVSFSHLLLQKLQQLCLCLNRDR